MKNSAETKSGVSLFKIDEHRLSLGLLVMLLIAGAGYGLATVISPMLPAAAKESVVSRNQIGDDHYGKEDWPEAIAVYSEMLVDDPDNGYVTMKMALAMDNHWVDTWNEYGKFISKNNDASLSKEMLETEAERFDAATSSFNRLLDNARYRRQSYVRLACLHATRSRIHDDAAEADKAVAYLTEMIEDGLTTSRGIKSTPRLKPLAKHPEYSRLVKEEGQLTYFGTFSVGRR